MVAYAADMTTLTGGDDPDPDDGDFSPWLSAFLTGDSNRYEAGSDPDNPQLAKHDPKTAKQPAGLARPIAVETTATNVVPVDRLNA
jgi:hypothetical protein